MKEDIAAMIRNLNFQHVFAFFAVMESGSFTKAAERLNMSQAAVSRIIANLECETKLILFVREVRGTVPTPAGRILYKEWKDGLRAISYGYTEAYKAQMGFINKISIGSIDMNQNLSHHVALIDWFGDTYSEDNFKIEYERTEVLWEGLISHKFDIILVNALDAEYLKMQGAKCKLVVERKCALYIHWSHPLYDKEVLEVKDFSGENITFFGTPDMKSSGQFQKFCREYKVDVSNIRFESDYKKALVSFIRDTGILFSEGIFCEGQTENARCLPLEGITSGLAAVWTNENMNVPVKRIMQYAQTL